jgi:general secretion pathway protein K
MPPGQPFESLDEIGLVLGVTPALLACLRPRLSLYRDTDPDPNAVDPAVRRALTETLGSPPPITDAAVDESVVTISVVATGREGARAVRQATLRMEAGQDASRPAGENGAAGNAAGDATAPFRVLEWHQ